ncbi:GlyGly-CTERM sorting domain-containing protein [Rheinheimera riviphila]|uniref:GlyGly-CTERM sorting domain-containing protein n=1 Tax=Rheinheimera riviphila TaxID=1834037 RepID=A0A437QFK6_9GAMM|nr:Ig domain-containing protein [Rheinheimera riviphila]RVU33313.1 GlyGly-CTERM sorting domain-containing protein [Rheinheimera riviphila]
MNIRNVAVFVLLTAVVYPSIASEHLTPLYTSVLSAEESQVQSKEQLALTEIASASQSNESMSNQLVARNTHVVMVSERGVSVLERTEQGLIKRHEEFFNVPQYNGSQQIFASPDGKTLVWPAGNGFVELKINADFSASHKMLSSSSTSGYATSAIASDSFVIYRYNESRYVAYQVTNLGLTQVGELAAIDEIRNTNLIFNSKDQILISSSTNNWPNVAVIIFKTQNGIFKETARHTFTTDYSFSGTVYDTDTGRLVIQSYTNSHHLLQINSSSGTIESVGTTPHRLVETNYYSDFSGVVSGNYLVTNRYQTSTLLYRDGNTFRESKRLDSYSGTMATHFNSQTGQQEYWKNSKWALQMFSVNQGATELIQERTAKQRGLPLLDRSTMLSSDDNRLVLIQDNMRVVLLALDVNKLPAEAYSHEISETNGSIGYNSQFVKVGTDKYLLAESTSYRVVNIDADGKVTMTAAKGWPQSLGYHLSDLQLKVKDGYVYLTSYGLAVLQLKNDVLTLIRKFNDPTLTTQEHQNILAVVDLNGDLFALMPAFGKIAKLKLTDGQLSIEKVGTMPNVNAPFREGRNRVFAVHYPESVLVLDADQNLKISAISNTSVDGDYYQKRFKIARSFQTHQPVFLLNDDVTGIWQKLTLSSDCCEPGASMQVIDSHLLSISNGNRQSLKVFKINSAPYLPTVVSPILLNQGVSSEVALAGFLQDDEAQPLSYSGLSTSGFTIADGNKLKYDGVVAGKGNVLLTVSDGELLTDLKLPFQVNAAPALIKALPTVVANQNAQLLFDLNDYIEDPEGSAISFQPQTMQGIQLSKSGLVSGTASGLQAMTFALKVTDKAGAVFATNLIVQVNAAPALTGSASLSAKVGQSFAIDLNTLITDAEKHKISLAASTLPAGLNISGAVISGTPTSSGSHNIQITATDELGARSQVSLSLNIAAEDKKSGGSLGWAWLALLLLARARRQH